MQLSVTTPSPDPTIAGFLLGSFSSIAAPQTGADLSTATGFAELLEQTVPVADDLPALLGASTGTPADLIATAGTHLSGAWAFASTATMQTVNEPTAPQEPFPASDECLLPAPSVALSEDRNTAATTTSAEAYSPATAEKGNGAGKATAPGGPSISGSRREITEEKRRGEKTADAGEPIAKHDLAPTVSPDLENIPKERSDVSPAPTADAAVFIAASTSQTRSPVARDAGDSASRRRATLADSASSRSSRTPFTNAIASGTLNERSESSFPAASTVAPRSLGASALANGSAAGAGSSSPFTPDLPTRNLGEWPLTAQPRTNPVESGEGCPSETELTAIAREIVASPLQLTQKTGMTGEAALARQPATSVSPVLPQSISSAGAMLNGGVDTPTLADSSPRPTAESRAIGSGPAIAPPVQDLGKENFAVSSAAPSRSGKSRDNAQTKSFVAIGEQEVADTKARLGTTSANSFDAMRSASTLPQALSDFHESVASSSVAPSGKVSAEASLDSHVAPEALYTAHRAVEAVLTAVHRFTSRDQHAVSLQFTVGGADLSVRVEMRANEVHATFTTDSAELRAALAHEWHSAQSTPSTDRPVKLASPVFAAGDGSSSGAAGDQNASRHRNSSTGDSNQPFSLAGLRSRAARAAAFEASVPLIAPVISRAPLSTALHLHTLA